MRVECAANITENVQKNYIIQELGTPCGASGSTSLVVYCTVPVAGNCFLKWLHAQNTSSNSKSFNRTARNHRVLSLKSGSIQGSIVVQILYRFMGSCGSSAMVFFEPAPAPATQVTERTTPAPVTSQPSTEKPPIPLSRSLSRSRRRTISRPEWVPRGRVSSQNSKPRSRTKSAPLPPQSLKSIPPLKPRARAKTLTGPRRSSRPDSRSPVPGELNE